MRLRDGEREVEVSGSAEFVRQTLDDLPSLFARLRGESAAPARPASITMPAPPDPNPAAEQEHANTTTAIPTLQPNGKGAGSLEDRVFAVLARTAHPMSVAAIRKKLGGQETGQQIRRILERASDRVVATSERPAAYALR